MQVGLERRRSTGTSTRRRARSWRRTSGRPATGEPSPPQRVRVARRRRACAELRRPPPPSLLRGPRDHGPERGRASTTPRRRSGSSGRRPASDYDMKVYRDSNGDGSADAASRSAHLRPGHDRASSRSTLGRSRPGDYVVRVINYAAVEPWTGHGHLRGPGALPGGPAGDLDALLRAARGHDPLGSPGVRGARPAALARPARRLPASAARDGAGTPFRCGPAASLRRVRNGTYESHAANRRRLKGNT